MNDVSAGYKKGNPVINGLDFTLEPGEVVAVLGPNGSGKTTFLRCVNAIIKPWKGSVYIEKTGVDRMTPEQIARKVGYVAQRAAPGRITVFDAALLGRKPHLSWKVGPEDLAKTDGALRMLGLEHMALRHIDELSGGELQKVFIARALAQEPVVLLLDEPTSSLDPKNQMDILSMIRHVVREHGMAAVMTMHDMNLAFRFADRLVFIKDGRVFAQGSPDRIEAGTIESVYGIRVDMISHKGSVVVVPRA